MRANRSMPTATVIPELPYDDVLVAAAWLANTFGFEERLRIGAHRIQLAFGDGAIIAIRSRGDGASQSLVVRIDDVDRHCNDARRAGARVVAEPADYPYGERQYTAVDIGGHRWTFSQSIADVDPADWGGDLVEG
jgi:uncharacterized glyoxalase superfamily protein PhnB